MKTSNCADLAIERSRRMCAAINETIAHMELAPSSQPHPHHPDPRAWAKSVEALGDEDPQVVLATTREG